MLNIGLGQMIVLIWCQPVVAQADGAELLEQWDAAAGGHSGPHGGHAGGHVHALQRAPLPGLRHQPAAGDDLQEPWLQPAHLWAPPVRVHLQGQSVEITIFEHPLSKLYGDKAWGDPVWVTGL